MTTPKHDAGTPESRSHREFRIQIDRVHYTVTQHSMTSAELRQLPQPPIGPERDLFEVVPGHPDRKIEDGDAVEMRNGLRFFTAPGTINPGQTTGRSPWRPQR